MSKIILNYTKEDDDLKFLVYCADQTAIFCKSDRLSMQADSSIDDLDSVIEQIFALYGEEFSQKKLNEFKRLRKSPTAPKAKLSVVNILCYINTVKALLTSGSLKNKDAIDRFTKLLVDRGVMFDPEFYMLEIRAGRITSIQDAAGMDKLYSENVRANRDYFICSGLRSVYEKEELLGNIYLFVLNIKKAKFKDLESEGMICCAEGDRVEALKVDAKEGSRIELEGHLSVFDDIEYGKVDLGKSAFRNVLSEFRIVDHHLVFKNTKVRAGGKYILTQTAEGAVH